MQNISSYRRYLKSSIRGFKRLSSVDNKIFDKYRSLAISYLQDFNSSYGDKLNEYDEVISTKLDRILPTQYRWLLSNTNLDALSDVLDNLEDNITDFENKEDNLKVYVGFLFLRFVLTNYILDFYVSVYMNNMSENEDPNKILSKKVLRYLDPIEELSKKTRDEWVNVDIDSSTAKYFYTSMKRILSIIDNVSM